MKRALIDRLIDPESGDALELRVFEADGDEIVSGVLRSGERWYPIIDGVPRSVQLGYDLATQPHDPFHQRKTPTAFPA